jgi:hypothetical protein
MSFEDTMELWLNNRAATDQEFAKNFHKDGKSVKGCCDYIKNQLAKKVLKEMEDNKELKKSGQCMMVTSAPSDDDCFALALEYYANDDIKAEDSKSDMATILSMAMAVNREAKKSEKKSENKASKETSKPTTKPSGDKPKSTIVSKPTAKPASKPTSEHKSDSHKAQELSLFDF